MKSSDKELGLRVAAHLVERGVETPFDKDPQSLFHTLEAFERRERIEMHFEAILKLLGMDMTDDSLCETPARMAKMYTQEIYYGLNYANFPKCTVVDNKMHYDEMVLERNIIVNSTCEHHGLPIIGSASVAYIPKDKVLGLSKINRIVDFFARRPQIQERLTEQIYHAMSFILETQDVAVCIAGEHMCVKTRGVQDACSDTVTSKLGGIFKSSPQVRAEFFSLMNAGKTVS